MKIKTSDLIGIALDYAVAIAHGATNFHHDTVAAYWITLDGQDRALSKAWREQSFLPSTNWAHGGPIIEQGEILLDGLATGGENYRSWSASIYENTESPFATGRGPTPLIAAMRCYVASKLGDEVDVPEELQ